jgi:hypothetical protein
MKNLNNKQLVDAINYRYHNNLNDDDYIAELCRRRKTSKKQIAEAQGEYFVMVDKKGQ